MSLTERDMSLIGDYVLGLSDAQEMALVEAGLTENGEWRKVHATLLNGLQELADTAEAVEPSPKLWAAVQAGMPTLAPSPSKTNARRLRPQGRREADTVAQHSNKSNSATQAASGQRPISPQEGKDAQAGNTNRGFWRGAGVMIIAASLALGLFISQPDWQRLLIEKPVLIAVLLDDNQEPGALIEAYPGQEVRVIPLRSFLVPAGTALQLWTEPNETMGPVSLGLLPTIAEVRLTDLSLPDPVNEQLYEITLEPANGSPTGKPTGPILLKGFAKLPL